MDLTTLGFNESLEKYRAENNLAAFDVGRVIAQHKDRYDVLSSIGELHCEITGNMRFAADSNEDLPAVGDWVALMAYDDDKGLIHAVYPRKTILKRKSAGEHSSAQLIASNIDIALIVQALDRDFNINRLERYLVLCHEAGIEPVIVMTKFDLISPAERREHLETIRARLKEIQIIEVSSEVINGYQALEAIIQPGLTYCLLGSSGVGKSTITNFLSRGEVMEVSEISSAVHKGRHTTTHRELIVLPSGAIIIDNPGMREVGIIDAKSGIDSTFEEIVALAEQCRYADCTHTTENKCAVLDALEDGSLDPDVYDNFMKLKKEKEYFEKSNVEKRRLDKKRGKMYKEHIQFSKKRKG